MLSVRTRVPPAAVLAALLAGSPSSLAAAPLSFSAAALQSMDASARWATGVVAVSSQYHTPEWSAEQALGYPNTYPQYGDRPTAWASQTPDGQREFIELSFDDPAPINYVLVVETLCPGAIDSVYTWNPNSSHYDLAWSGSAKPALAAATLWSVTFPTTTYPVSRIRISLNSPAVPSWNEVDAVAIGAGGKINLQWASGAAASSQYGPVGYAPQQATGPPDTYPNYGDLTSAWASLTGDGSREWLQLSYSEPESIARVDVYETFKPGAIDSIYVRDALDGSLQLVYAALPAVQGDTCVILRAHFPITPYPVDGVRITLASDVVPGWNEIDAVAISPDSLPVFLPGITDVPDRSLVPVRLEPARPNPFHETAAIGFILERGGAARVQVFDVRGTRVATLASGDFAAGSHQLVWRGLDDSGRRVEPGLYFIRLEASGVRRTWRVVRLE